MNHPTVEQWMEYLYSETTPARRSELESHLAQCPTCTAQLAQWQDGKNALDQWHWPDTRPVPLRRRTPVKWALAALLMIAAGFALGRLASPQSNPPQEWAQKISSQVQLQVQSEVNQHLQDRLQTLAEQIQMQSADLPASEMAALAREQQALNHSLHYLEGQRQQDLQVLYDAILKLEANRVRDFSTLRRELETVAMFAESHLRKTKMDLINLATYAAPNPPPHNPEPLNP
jgi:hypothetical protein